MPGSNSKAKPYSETFISSSQTGVTLAMCGIQNLFWIMPDIFINGQPDARMLVNDHGKELISRMHKLKIITSTTREGRKGIVIADWMTRLAKEDNRFETELLDLAAINLPFMNEPNHPRLRQYQFDHTKAWSDTIAAADAFVVILSEYNFSFPAPIKNALDYLFHEWRYKPVAFLSYGGASGGMRSAQMLKQVVTALNMMPIAESVAIPWFTKSINDEEQFEPDDKIVQPVHTMLGELYRWSEALRGMRLS